MFLELHLCVARVADVEQHDLLTVACTSFLHPIVAFFMVDDHAVPSHLDRAEHELLCVADDHVTPALFDWHVGWTTCQSKRAGVTLSLIHI